MSSPFFPFLSAAAGRTSIGTTPLRIWHRTRGYGQDASETAFGGRAAFELVDAVGFIDGQFRISNESRGGANIGGGFRWRAPGIMSSGDQILGLTGWYDGQETEIDNYFNQLGVSLESLGEFIDLRLNANIPLESTKTGDDLRRAGVASFTGIFLAEATSVSADVPLRVVDFEVAPRIYNLNAWLYGGGYQMDGDGVSEFGAKGGARGYVTNDLAIDVGVSDDDVFGTTTSAQIIWTPGRTGSGPTSWIHTLADRMREPVYRNTYVASRRIQVAGAIPLTDADGDNIRIIHVDSSAPAGGDGSFENPLNNLNDVDDFSEQGDIILAHAESVFIDQTATLQDEQRFLGEGLDQDGNEVINTVVTTELGTINIPETAPGAQNATRPTIDNTGTLLDAVLLAGEAGIDVSTFNPIVVSNFDVIGGENAIDTLNGVGAVQINRLTITDTTGNGIQLTPLVETLANNTDRVRLAPVIDNVDFFGVGGDDINIDDDSGEPDTTPRVGTIAITNIESEDGVGVGVNLVNLKRNTTITNIVWDGGTTGDGAIRVENALSTAAVTVNGTNTIDNGAGFAIALIDSANTTTVTGTTVTNTGGDTIVVEDGAANLNFTGRIDQNQNASVVSVSDGHTGNLTFRELTAGAGVIDATNGDGLQFNDADGNYTFVNGVELTGVSAGINVVNDSDGVITVSDGTITNATGTAVNFDGGDANLNFVGRIEQTANNAAVLTVTGGHTGTLNFTEGEADTGVIEANIGPGLTFNNADGAYVFNDEVLLNGGEASIDVLNDSEGTFTFADADITFNGTGGAVLIDGSEVQAFTLSGQITSTGAASRPVDITNNTGGSITFNSTITATGGLGIRVNNNTDTTVLFTDQVTLTTGVNQSIAITNNDKSAVTFNDAVTVTNSLGLLVENNTETDVRLAGETTFDTEDFQAVRLNNNSDGSIRFDELAITTDQGDGFTAIASDNVTVQGTSNTIETGAGVALNLNDVEVGAAGINFESVSSDGASSGIIINNVRGGAVNIGDAGATGGAGGTIQNSTSDAIVINNAATVNLNGLNIEDTTGDAIDVTHTGSATSVVRVNNTSINNATGFGIDYNRSATAVSRLTLVGNSIDNTGDDGVTLDIAGSNTVDVTVNGGNNITNSSGDSALALNTTGGAKTVRLLIDGNAFNNDSTDPTVAITHNSAGTLNATVVDNTFTNSDAVSGRAYSMTSVSGVIRLDLNTNTGINANPTDEFLLTQIGGSTFNIVDEPTVDARNVGDVEQIGTFGNDTGPLPQPTP